MTCEIKSTPLLFDEYFELKEEELSPFIEKKSKKWGRQLALRSSFLAAFFLFTSFLLSFFASLLPISYIFLILVYFIVGIPSLIESLEDILALEVNIDVLMTIAAFSSIFIGSGLEGALLLVLFSISHALEDYVTGKAKGDISKLHSLSPTKAVVIGEKGSLHERSIKDISIGTKILVKAHQIVPLDGIVLEGVSSLTLSHLTGESLPIKKESGDEVPAGAYNLEGSLTVEVTKLSTDSTLARILQLVTDAERKKPRLQRLFDKFSQSYALIIIGISAIVALFFPFLLSIPFLGNEGSLYRALAFLIAASPCALIIALPTAYLSAIGSSARQGILLKGGTVLDAIAACKAIAFDKTGTLTTGELEFIKIESLDNDYNQNEALSYAYTLERNASHPIAKALTHYGEKKKLIIQSIEAFKSIPGLGLTGFINKKSIYIGHLDYIEKDLSKKDLIEIKIRTEEAKKKGLLIAILKISNELFILTFKDKIRENIKKTLKELKDQNFHLLMLTGDHFENANQVSQDLGLEKFEADLRPEGKLQFVAELSEKYGLIMIGDGVNDAPALARATVGISMGKVGTVTAMDAADIILLQDNIEHLSWLIKKGKETKKIVRQNLSLSILAIILASVPALIGYIPLWLAVVLHEGGTVLVGLNGLRLLKR